MSRAAPWTQPVQHAARAVAHPTATLQPLFTKKHVAEYAGHMAGAADALAREWIDRPEIDLDRECRRLTLRVIGRSVFGLDLGERAETLDLRSGSPCASSAVGPPGRCVLPDGCQHPRDDGCRSPWRRSVPSSTRPSTPRARILTGTRLFTCCWTRRNRRPVSPMTQQAIADELLAFLVAGHDTTATTLAYRLWAVGRDPVIQDRLAAEVADIGDRALTVDDVSRLPLTIRVIHQALRLCPPAAVVPRMTMRDTIVDGFGSRRAPT